MRMVAVRLFFGLLMLGALAHGAAHKAAAGKPAKSKIADLADTVDRSVILNKFAALMQASDLGTFLSSRGPFTMFVPTNSAFSKLPPGMFEDLLRPENKVQLQRIILFSLVSGKAWDLKDMKTVKVLTSCEGSPLALRTSRSGAQFVLKSRIVRADIHCANGLMHQVDSLLMPPKLLLVAAVVQPDGSTNVAPAAAVAVPADTAVTNAAPAARNAVTGSATLTNAVAPTSTITDVPISTNVAPVVSAATNAVPLSPPATTDAAPSAAGPAMR